MRDHLLHEDHTIRSGDLSLRKRLQGRKRRKSARLSQYFTALDTYFGGGAPRDHVIVVLKSDEGNFKRLKKAYITVSKVISKSKWNTCATI